MKLPDVKRFSVTDLVEKTIRRAVGFVRRQKHNYRVSVARQEHPHSSLPGY